MFYRLHAVLESHRLDRILHPVGIVNLQLGQLANGRGDIVEATRQRLDVHLAALRHDPAEARDLPLEALDLSGLTHCAGQQLDHVGELRHLVSHILDVCARLDLRLDLAFEPFEPPAEAVHRSCETLDQSCVQRAFRGARGNRTGRLARTRGLTLSRPDLVDCRLQAVAWIGRHRRRRWLFEAVDGALDRAQRVAMPGVAFLLGELVPKVLHPLAQSRAATRARDLAVDLIEQRYEFMAKRLPVAGATLMLGFIGLGLRIRAGHGRFQAP